MSPLVGRVSSVSVCAFEVLAVEDGLGGVRRRDHDVRTRHRLGARFDRLDVQPEVGPRLASEALAVLACRQVHLHGVELADGGDRSELAAGLRAAADQSQRARVLSDERVDADRARRAGVLKGFRYPPSRTASGSPDSASNSGVTNHALRSPKPAPQVYPPMAPVSGEPPDTP